ncbi:hypothetical protein [Terriglobus roseus]|uniref:Uncharacterized protein n=1 Tax=Terriglobus roseus TaxID=392734 RepID=A0A1G7QQ00_9BACT|nr:hypothetical protein [Terriglobus roseus]SDG00544.1 hypothetical protein SAMN05444167_3953 [Terriglobus roseus]
MSLLNWFKRSSPSSPQLNALVNRVVVYLRSRPGGDQVVPKIVGKAIGETEIRALTALRVLEEQGIVHHHFGLYCTEKGIPLESIDDLSQLPAEKYCDACDEDHSEAEGEYKVEIYYTIDPRRLAQFRERKVAA